MNTTFYALRHKATGHLMPAKRGRGYSNWTPTESDPKGGLSDTYDMPRLFPTFKGADNARVLWAQGVHTREYVRNGEADTGYDDHNEVKDVGRKKDDIVVITMTLMPGDKAVVHIKFSQQACVDMMRLAFHATLVEFEEVSADADTLGDLASIAQHFGPLTITFDKSGPDKSPCWVLKAASAPEHSWVAPDLVVGADMALRTLMGPDALPG